MTLIRETIVSDEDKNKVHLTNENNFPVAIKDKNGLELEMNEDGSVPVRSRPQSTPTIILPLVSLIGDTTLAAEAVKNVYTITVASTVGMVVGQHIRIVDDTNDKFYFGEIIDLGASPVVELDTQIDFEYESGAEVTFSTKNMAVDGSITPVIYRARTGNLSIPSVVNVTRLLITCICADTVSLEKFGDLPKLLRGLALRVVRETTQANIFNVKNIEEIVNIAFDYNPFEKTNPAQGVDGFSTRITFGSEGKMGTVIQLTQLDNLEMLVQDDLLTVQSGSQILSLTVTFEGNIVQS